MNIRNIFKLSLKFVHTERDVVIIPSKSIRESKNHNRTMYEKRKKLKTSPNCLQVCLWVFM